MYGDYECMRRGSVADCLVDLTSGIPERYLLRDLHLDADERNRGRLKAALADALSTHSFVMLTCDGSANAGAGGDDGGRAPAQVRFASDVRSEKEDTWPAGATRNQLSSPREAADEENADEEEPDEEEPDEEGDGDEEVADDEETASENASRTASARSRVQSALKKRRRKFRGSGKQLVSGPGALAPSGLVIGRGYILEAMADVRLDAAGKKTTPVTLLRLCNAWNDAAWNGPWSAEYVLCKVQREL